VLLQPQHFQQQDHYHEGVCIVSSVVPPFSWGVYRLRVMIHGLQNFVFEIEMRDPTFDALAALGHAIPHRPNCSPIVRHDPTAGKRYCVLVPPASAGESNVGSPNGARPDGVHDGATVRPVSY